MSNSSFARLGEAIARRWQMRDGIHRLSQLDDRMLADIGISRSQIRGAVRGRRAF